VINSKGHAFNSSWTCKYQDIFKLLACIVVLLTSWLLLLLTPSGSAMATCLPARLPALATCAF
jgi:hypothetical protein